MKKFIMQTLIVFTSVSFTMALALLGFYMALVP